MVLSERRKMIRTRQDFVVPRALLAQGLKVPDSDTSVRLTWHLPCDVALHVLMSRLLHGDWSASQIVGGLESSLRSLIGESESVVVDEASRIRREDSEQCQT